MRLVLENCAIATVDAAGSEHACGHVVVADGRIEAVGEGATDAPGRRLSSMSSAEVIGRRSPSNRGLVPLQAWSAWSAAARSSFPHS